MSYGGYPQGTVKDAAEYFLARGIILGRDMRVFPVDPGKINGIRQPFLVRVWGWRSNRQTSIRRRDRSEVHGAEAALRLPQVEQKYSWMKAPRYEDQPMEVGPLARMLVAYAAGQPDVKELVDARSPR